MRHKVALLSLAPVVFAGCLGPNPLLENLQDEGGMGPPEIDAFTIDGSAEDLPVVEEARTFTLSVQASDDDGITLVEFLDEGTPIGEGVEMAEGVWEASWTATGEEFDGNHKISVRVVDGADEESTAGPIDIPIDMPTGGELAVDAFDLGPSEAGSVNACALNPSGDEFTLVGTVIATLINLEVRRVDRDGAEIGLADSSVDELDINGSPVNVDSGEAAFMTPDGALFVAGTATTTGAAVVGLRYAAGGTLDWTGVNMSNGATVNEPKGALVDGSEFRIATLTTAAGFRIDVFDTVTGGLLPSGFAGPPAAVDLAPGPDEGELWVAGTSGEDSRLHLYAGGTLDWEASDPDILDGRLADIERVDDGGLVLAGVREHESVTGSFNRAVAIGTPYVVRVDASGSVMWAVDLETDNQGDSVGGIAISPQGYITVVRGVGCKAGASACMTQSELPSEVRVTSLSLEDGTERWNNDSLGKSYGAINVPSCVEVDDLGHPWVAFTGGDGSDNRWYAARLNP